MRPLVMTIALIATLVACSMSQPWEVPFRLGRDALMKRDYPLAIRHLEFANAMADPRDTPDEIRARIWFWLGLAYLESGKPREAESALRAALFLLEKGSAPDDQVSTVTHNLAAALQNQGKYAEAETFHRRTLTSVEKFRGPNSLEVARALNNLASTLYMLDRPTEAQTLLKRAQGILRAQSVDDPELLTLVDLGLAESMRLQGHLDDAESSYRRVLEALSRRETVHTGILSSARLGLAFVLLARGNVRDGETLYQKALSAYEKEWGDKHPLVEWVRREYNRVQGAPKN